MNERRTLLGTRARIPQTRTRDALHERTRARINTSRPPVSLILPAEPPLSRVHVRAPNAQTVRD